MKTWATWYPDLLPHVPGCPQILAEHELKRAAQVLFRRTRAWRVDRAAVAVVAGQESVVIAPTDAGQELVRIEAVWYDGKPLGLVTDEVLDAGYADDWRTHTGTPTDYLQLVPGEIRLHPLPVSDATTGVTARLSVAPSEAATGLPDDLALKFRDEIQVGAKARLMLYPNRPWTNGDLASVYGQAFDNLVGTATAAAARSFAQARIPSRMKWC
jgi:hypothetical protein